MMPPRPRLPPHARAQTPPKPAPEILWTAPGMKPSPHAAPYVLSEAFRRAATELRLSRIDQARALGVSASTVTRLYLHGYEFVPGRKEWEHALLLLRCYRSLRVIFGGDLNRACVWFGQSNRGLHAAPIDLISTSEGLVRVTQYLDAVRAGR